MKNPPHHLISLVLGFSAVCLPLSADNTQRPNIILAMADDMGWGDPGYNSMVVTLPDGTHHPDQGWIQTPVMDEMAANGLKFNRWIKIDALSFSANGDLDKAFYVLVPTGHPFP